MTGGTTEVVMIAEMTVVMRDEMREEAMTGETTEEAMTGETIEEAMTGGMIEEDMTEEMREEAMTEEMIGDHPRVMIATTEMMTDPEITGVSRKRRERRPLSLQQ